MAPSWVQNNAASGPSSEVIEMGGSNQSQEDEQAVCCSAAAPVFFCTLLVASMCFFCFFSHGFCSMWVSYKIWFVLQNQLETTELEPVYVSFQLSKASMKGTGAQFWRLLHHKQSQP